MNEFAMNGAIGPRQPLGEWMQVCEITSTSKTKRWRVFDSHDAIVGEIFWFGRWRQYSFAMTGAAAIFNKGCLDDIAKFLDEQMRLWREAKRVSRA